MSTDADVTLTGTTKAAHKYASRKFILACVVWFLGTLVWIVGPQLFMTPQMATDQWISFSQWVLALYFAGNVGQTLAMKIK